MSTNKKTISIPSSVGSNNLSDVFGKISLNPEVKELLASLDAELTARYNPGGEKPIIQVVSSTGKTMCTLEEFRALSGYRRFIADVLKEAERASASDEKVKIISFILGKAVPAGVTVPERILEQNMTKFNQIGSSIQVLDKNLEVIGETIDNEWRKYVTEQATSIRRVLLSCQMACMGSVIVDKTYIEDGLFDAHTPKWLYTKFCDKNFTNNLKRDSYSLLFPKSNFLKAIAFTTKELQHEAFRKSNYIVLQNSGGIIALAGKDFSQLFPTSAKEFVEPVKEFLTNYQWVLTSPTKADEILAARESGKNLPVIRDVQASTRSGRGSRPESDLARTNREIANTLNRVQGVWNSIMNYSIPVANPKTEFWDLLFQSDAWDITPTNSIYNCIRAEPTAVATLEKMRTEPSKTVLERIAAIVSQNLMIPSGSSDAKIVGENFEDLVNKVDEKEKDKFPDVSATYKLGSLKDFKPEDILSDEIAKTRSFLGMKPKKKSTKKKTGAGAVRLHTSVLNELIPLKEYNNDVYEKVVDWLMTTFKTGQRKDLQLVAASRVIGEALKHREDIFDDDFVEEEVLQEVEDYYSDDSE